LSENISYNTRIIKVTHSPRQPTLLQHHWDLHDWTNTWCSYSFQVKLKPIQGFWDGTEWPIMRWCAVKKLLTHSRGFRATRVQNLAIRITMDIVFYNCLYYCTSHDQL